MLCPGEQSQRGDVLEIDAREGDEQLDHGAGQAAYWRERAADPPG